MSFCFPSWSEAFSPSFYEDAKGMLEAALNKGNKPPVIQGPIEVVELSMGKEPPTLTLLEIGDLSLDRFRGILRLTYTGDAWLELRCRVQANPLSHNPNLLPSSILPMSTPLAASQPLLVPMTLRLSRLHLRAILILVVSASKGITLVFKNDPLQNVEVSSTFDSVEVIRGYLQQEIEGQLREMFREDLPGIIHRLSQRWFTGTGTAGKVETPYRDADVSLTSSAMGIPSRTDTDDEPDPNDPYYEKPIFPRSPQPLSTSPSATMNITPRTRRISSQAQAPKQRRASTTVSESPTSYTVFPDIEDYDPTYGLRPEGVPTHSGYEAFGRLWEKAREGQGRGLGSLMNMPVEDRGDVSDEEWDEDDDGSRSLNMVEMSDALAPFDRPGPSRVGSHYGSIAASAPPADEDQVEWETFPAVGGGIITRPRVYHIQSQIRAPSEAGVAMPSPSGTGSVTARASSVGGASSTIGSLRGFPPASFNGYTNSLAQAAAGPGPSSLRRMTTSKSDFSLARPRSSTRSEAITPTHSAKPSLYSAARPRQPAGTTASSSAARTSGSSWDTDKATRSATASTRATSQLPSSRSVSVDQKGTPSVAGHRVPSLSGTSFPPRHFGPGGITLPLNSSVSQLAMLSNSYHTLSPYARGHEHIAVRSFPHLGKTQNQARTTATPGAALARPGIVGDEAAAVKARRKRIFRLNKGDETSASALRVGEVETQARAREPPPSVSPETSSPGSSDPSLLGGGGGGSGWHRQPASLTGVAQRVMQSQAPGVGLASAGQGRGPEKMRSSRPSAWRAPDSRTSYGFPPVSHFDSIAE